MINNETDSNITSFIMNRLNNTKRNLNTLWQTFIVNTANQYLIEVAERSPYELQYNDSNFTRISSELLENMDLMNRRRILCIACELNKEDKADKSEKLYNFCNTNDRAWNILTKEEKLDVAQYMFDKENEDILKFLIEQDNVNFNYLLTRKQRFDDFKNKMCSSTKSFEDQSKNNLSDINIITR